MRSADSELTKHGVVEQRAFEMLAGVARAAAADLRDLVPSFNEGAFFSHENRQIDRRYYRVSSTRRAQAMVCGPHQTEVFDSPSIQTLFA